MSPLDSSNAVNPVSQSLQNIGITAQQVRTDALFVYPFETRTVAAASQISAAVQIQGDSVFQVIRLAFLCFQGAGVAQVQLPPILINLADTGSGANLFSAPIPLHSIAYGGAGFGPFDVPASRFFAPMATITVTYFNLDPANAFNVALNMQGRKLFA